MVKGAISNSNTENALVDTSAITTQNDIWIVTMLPKIKSESSIVRVLCLVKNEIQERIRLMEHFMSEDFSYICSILGKEKYKTMFIIFKTGKISNPSCENFNLNYY